MNGIGERLLRALTLASLGALVALAAEPTDAPAPPRLEAHLVFRHDRIPAGTIGEAAVVIDVPPGRFIPSLDQQEEGLTPTRIEPPDLKLMRIDRLRVPPTQRLDLPGEDGRPPRVLRVWQGRVVIVYGIAVSQDLPGGRRPLSFKLHTNIIDAQGSVLAMNPIGEVQGELTIGRPGETAREVNGLLFVDPRERELRDATGRWLEASGELTVETRGAEGLERQGYQVRCEQGRMLACCTRQRGADPPQVREFPLTTARYLDFWQTVGGGAWTLKHQRPPDPGHLPLYRFAFVLGERRHGFEWQGERGSGGEHDRLARYFLDTVSRWME